MIMLCPKCKGEGSIARQGWHDEPCWIREECKNCEGTGRLVRTVDDVPFKPLDENDCSR
jgi:DnaJ-class molecular chaperone